MRSIGTYPYIFNSLLHWRTCIALHTCIDDMLTLLGFRFPGSSMVRRNLHSISAESSYSSLMILLCNVRGLLIDLCIDTPSQGYAQYLTPHSRLMVASVAACASERERREPAGACDREARVKRCADWCTHGSREEVAIREVYFWKAILNLAPHTGRNFYRFNWKEQKLLLLVFFIPALDRTFPG